MTSTQFRKAITALALAAVVATSHAGPPIRADSIAVTTTMGDADGSLRQAIASAYHRSEKCVARLSDGALRFRHRAAQ